MELIPGLENPMEEAGVPRTKWVLTEEALQQFLAYLDPDQDRAGEKYEELRRKLTTFFRCNGFWNAEDHVDETIDRTIRRLGEVRELMPFIRGVARHVASEVRRRAPKEIPIETLRNSRRKGSPTKKASGVSADRWSACTSARSGCLPGIVK